MRTKNKLRVLHIMSGYGGGISSFIRNLAKEIDVEKISFDVISFTDYSQEFIEEISRTGGNLITMLRPKEVGYKKFIQDTQEKIEFHGPYDVVECHLSGNYAAMFKYLCRNSGTNRFVVHAHASSDDYEDSVITNLKRTSDRVISNLVATQLTSCSLKASEFMFGENAIKNSEIMHIPNSIDLNKYILEYDKEQIKQLKKENNIPLDTIIIGNVARFNLQKNHVFMVKLIEYMAAKNVNFTWLFIGAGELEEQIKRMVQEKKIENHVRFLGRREDAHILYQLMDVFVLPSHYEGLPTVIVETQAAGVNSVVADTITEEVDIDLDMVEFLPLDANLSLWLKAIYESAEKKVSSVNHRVEKINRKGFSNQSASRLYEAFLFGDISNYRIGDDFSHIELK